MSEKNEGVPLSVTEAEVSPEVLAFRQEMKKIKSERLNDGTIELMDVDNLGTQELEVWQNFKDLLAKLPRSILELKEESLRSLNDEVKLAVEQLDAAEQQLDGCFYSWMKNRLGVVFYGLHFLTQADYQEDREEIIKEFSEEQNNFLN